MKLEVITPDSKVFAGEVSAVQFPGIDGSFQVLNNRFKGKFGEAGDHTRSSKPPRFITTSPHSGR